MTRLAGGVALLGPVAVELGGDLLEPLFAARWRHRGGGDTMRAHHQPERAWLLDARGGRSRARAGLALGGLAKASSDKNRDCSAIAGGAEEHWPHAKTDWGRTMCAVGLFFLL